MINLFKTFYRSHRIGGSAGKTLLWIWVKKDLPKIKGDLGLDLAGGAMGNKHFFSTKKYVCVDINLKDLERGKNKYPDAIIVNSRIQEYMKDEHQNKPDVLVCFQTMGTNAFFEHDESFEISSDDGKKLKMLKRHLKTAYNMTPDEYREKWGLPRDYPMVAPNYAKHRSDLAKEIGLGKKSNKSRA